MTDEPTEDPSRAADDDGGDADDDAPKRRLVRGRDHKVLAGVCDGAGRYFDIDPVIFRVVLAVLALTGGIGLIVYGIAWLVVPQDGERQNEAHRLLSGRIEGAPLTAVLMALVGCGLYASMIDNGANQAFSLLLLTATAGAVYWSRQRRSGLLAGEAASFAAAGTVADAPPAVQAPPAPGSASWWRDPLSKDGPTYLWGPDDGPYEAADRKAWRQRKASGRRAERSWPFGLGVFLLVVTAVVVGTGVAWPYQVPNVAVEIGLTAALGVFGTAFVVASFAGRTRGGTVFFAMLTIAGLIGAASLPKDRAGWFTTWQPSGATSVQESYARNTGSGTLDLRTLALNGGTVATHVNVHAGEVVLKLPKSATVFLNYHVGIGDVLLPGKAHNGVNLKNDENAPLVYAPPAGTMSTGTITVDVQLGVGDLRVKR